MVKAICLPSGEGVASATRPKAASTSGVTIPFSIFSDSMVGASITLPSALSPLLQAVRARGSIRAHIEMFVLFIKYLKLIDLRAKRGKAACYGCKCRLKTANLQIFRKLIVNIVAKRERPDKKQAPRGRAAGCLLYVVFVTSVVLEDEVVALAVYDDGVFAVHVLCKDVL